jgi:alpha-N-acetylglucosaminidase
MSLILSLAISSVAAATNKDTSPVASARAVINRVIGKRAAEVDLQVVEASQPGEFYEYSAGDGKLTVRSNTAVGLCHGFHEYLKATGCGIVSWSGKRVAIPARWPDAKTARQDSPYKYRYYFNVVTYGYSLPYWDWKRWEQEIDWMALHGINMPLATVGTEAIAQRVWLKLGLTQKEIDDFTTGPAHLAWMRMGNMIKFDGPLSQDWHADQIKLEHKMIDRMRSLGMHPIAPAFAGFVPNGIKRVYPDLDLRKTEWGGGFTEEYVTHFIFADNPLFKTIGKMHIQEWEKEFGKNTFFTADSFNEMNIPVAESEIAPTLAKFGEGIYDSIKAGNPDAVWVMQGWMFGFQRNIWNPTTLSALLSKVPDDKMLLLDLATDYNATWWRNGMNWDYFPAFFGKPWVYSTIPNMGGKTGYTGHLDYYASGHVKALESPNKGKMVGYGFAMEGIENNEVIYELLSDAAWTTKAIDLGSWLPKYLTARYGSCPPAMVEAWKLLRESVYGTFNDHPKYTWQHQSWDRDCTANRSPKVKQAALLVLSCSKELGAQPLYRADAIEIAMQALGIKAQEQLEEVKAAHPGDPAKREAKEKEFLETLRTIDRLLESHPIDRLDRWTTWARSHGKTRAEKDAYEANAKRIVTTWGGSLSDYAARLWSGLIRDYYIPRNEMLFEQLRTGKKIDVTAWEEQWVKKPGVSKIKPFADPIAAANKALAE